MESIENPTFRMHSLDFVLIVHHSEDAALQEVSIRLPKREDPTFAETPVEADKGLDSNVPTALARRHPRGTRQRIPLLSNVFDEELHGTRSFAGIFQAENIANLLEPHSVRGIAPRHERRLLARHQFDTE